MNGPCSRPRCSQRGRGVDRANSSTSGELPQQWRMVFVENKAMPLGTSSRSIHSAVRLRSRSWNTANRSRGSTRLRQRATALGWPPPSILVIDQDLGLSGSGSENRLGFQRLLADIAQNRVGLVLALEISRLARNSRDWHNLFDLCAVCDVLLADEDGVYDPSDINDRLILGMKGIMSEMEIHIMKVRLERGRKNKALRGELFHSVPWGYVLQPDQTVAFDPDEQVRATVRRLFDAFQRVGSAFAVVRELRRDDVKLPLRNGNGLLLWRIATVTILQTALHHPLYAGATRGDVARLDSTSIPPVK